MSEQSPTIHERVLNPAWLDSEIRQEVAAAVVRLNGAAARWALSTPAQYRDAEAEFLKFWIDLQGVMAAFTDSYVPPDGSVEPPRPFAG